MKAVNTKSVIELHRTGTPYSALILAAGSSGRMGTDKAMLLYDRDVTFSNHLVDRYCEAKADQVLLVVNDKFIQNSEYPSNVRVIINKNVELGRSHSMSMGIEKVIPGNACFIQNIDNPYLDNVLLGKMLEMLQEESYVVPMCGERGGHPILLSPQISDYIRQINVWNDFREILNHFNRIQFSWEDDRILLNINTPEEYDLFVKSKR
jgi:molybdenum cofactor cytidylyltransferase